MGNVVHFQHSWPFTHLTHLVRAVRYTVDVTLASVGCATRSKHRLYKETEINDTCIQPFNTDADPREAFINAFVWHL